MTRYNDSVHSHLDCQTPARAIDPSLTIADSSLFIYITLYSLAPKWSRGIERAHTPKQSCIR